MASSINASTSGAGGLISTADSSGVLNIQTAGTNAITVNAGATPYVVLGTNGTAYAGDMLQLNAVGPANISLSRYDNSTTYGNIKYYKSRSGTLGTQGAVQNGDGIAAILSYGSDGTSFVNNGVAQFAVAGSVSTGIVPSGYYVSTMNTSGTLSLQFGVQPNGDLSFNSGYGSAAVAYGCRAWVNFNGTGTVAIRASGNVSSITDNGTGDYTMNFTTAMPDTNYCVSLGATLRAGGDSNSMCRTYATANILTTSYRFRNAEIAGGIVSTDPEVGYAAIFR